MASAIVRNVVLSPALTGTALYLLTRAPESYRQPLLQRLAQYLSPTTIARLVTGLKWLFGIGLARNLNVFLSDLAQNNWRFRSERHRYDWPREIAVVTGAAGGFGGLMSKDLAARGVNVVAVDVKDELPEDMRGNAKIAYERCDITDRAAVMQLRDKIERERGHVSILVNNAGVCWQHTVLDASQHALQQLFDVNVISHYYTLQAFLPAMIKQRKGHVVTMASVASFVSPAGLTPYCNTKAAVMSLHEGVQTEMASMYGAPEIKFTIVHPWYSNTQLIKRFVQDIKDAGSFMLNPQIVSDAVVAQIMACRSRQIVLANGSEFVSTVRAWPHWLSSLLTKATKPIELVKMGSEHTSPDQNSGKGR